MSPAGYSETPLAPKLGIKDGFRISLINAPVYYMDLFTDLPPHLYFDDNGKQVDFIHFFIQSKDEYLSVLPGLKDRLKT